MFIADALSRSYRLTTDNAQHDSSEMHALREVHHTDGLSVSPKRLEEFKLRTVQDVKCLVIRDLLCSLDGKEE